MSAEKRMVYIFGEVIQSLASTLISYRLAYYDSKEGQQEFAGWKEKR